MRNKLIATVISSVSLLLGACTTDVDIIADYKEKAVVYAFLDISQPIQYFKINKVFLGVGDANQMATVPDSVNFNPADMNIVLEKYKDGSLISAIKLRDTIIQGGQEGLFSKENNIIYFTRELMDASCFYTLKIENTKTGYKAEASSNVIKAIAFAAGRTSFNFVGSDGKYTPNNSIEWNSVPNAKVFQLTFRFHYKEFKNGVDTLYKTIDWLFAEQYALSTTGGLLIKKSIKGEEFFTFLKSVKASYFSDNTFKRIAFRGQLIITAVGENYQIYRDLNAPFSSNFQEKPVYTNIKNGIGIFDSRVTTYDLPRPFNSFTIDEIVDGKYTDDLGFIKP
jgi:hypothetical protein